MRWLNHDPVSTKIFIESGGFPSTTADLSDPAFTDAESKYFGGQKVNQVLADAAGTVQPDWSYLPIQPTPTPSSVTRRARRPTSTPVT